MERRKNVHCHQKLKDAVSKLKAKALQWECTHILEAFKEEVEVILNKFMAMSIHFWGEFSQQLLRGSLLLSYSSEVVISRCIDP